MQKISTSQDQHNQPTHLLFLLKKFKIYKKKNKNKELVEKNQDGGEPKWTFFLYGGGLSECKCWSVLAIMASRAAATSVVHRV